MRRHRRLQKLLQEPLSEGERADSDETETLADSDKADTLTDSDESTWSSPNSACSGSPPRNARLNNLDRVVESVTPSVPVQYFTETRIRAAGTREDDLWPFFCLGDLWESFHEWSAYGVGVPLSLNEIDSVNQYYVPSLSGIQLYADPLGLRMHREDGNAESLRETSSAGSSDWDVAKPVEGGIVGPWGQHDLVKLNSQRMHGLTLTGKPPNSSYGDKNEICSSNGLLVFEYLEHKQPYFRDPLYVKVSDIALEFPALKTCRSCDLLPASWLAVAWYPIYRIPKGPGGQHLDVSFLTFHSLSTHSSRRENQIQLDAPAGIVGPSKIAQSSASLSVFGLAPYKSKNSIITPGVKDESQKARSLLQAADRWLQHLEVNLPDYRFLVSHKPQWTS